jgi:DNA-binding GntR family transcriptional regulator
LKMAEKNQAQSAYQKIREKLISRTLEPGYRLIESVWAENLKVNRADIRQALSRLLGEGLLKAGEKGGFFVREFTTEDMRQLNEVRFVLETAAARLAIERATADDIAALRQVCEHMKLMAENGYAMGVFEADLRFHEVLINAAHNEKLRQIYENANLPLSKSLNGLTVDKDKLLSTVNEHCELTDALSRKDLARTAGTWAVRAGPDLF